jgi:hypothetical protein
LAEWDRRRAWSASGAKSAAAELAHRTRQSLADCKARLALGRAMGRLPVAAEAFAAGDISATHVRVLSRARNPRTEALLARDEAVLVDRAMTLRFSDFGRAVDYWSLRADPDGTSENELKRREQRHLSLVETTGGWSLSGWLTSAGGEAAALELGRLEQLLFDADWAEARLRLGRDPSVTELGRTSSQRRADALVEMARRSAGSNGRAKPLFTVVMGPDALRDLCELEASRHPLPPAALREWLDDAVVECVLFAEGERQVRVSRKRRFTGALRRLLEVRDRECFHPTCEEPAPHCEGDHIEPWGAGGITSEDNGRMACATHNRNRHRRGPPRAA